MAFAILKGLFVFTPFFTADFSLWDMQIHAAGKNRV